MAGWKLLGMIGEELPELGLETSRTEVTVPLVATLGRGDLRFLATL
jgi:hypothetical protein